MRLRDSIRQAFRSARRSTKDTFAQFDQMFDDFEESFIDIDLASAEAGPGETVTTRREEIRPDGTRVVTTVIRTTVSRTKGVVAKERKA